MKVVLILFAAFASLLILAASLRRATIFQYERGLRYRGGRFASVLGPGSYWYSSYRTEIRSIDVRPRVVSIAGQEVLSSDGVTLRVSLAARYAVVDPAAAVHEIQSFEEALYVELQIALRQIVGGTDIDSLLAQRNQISTRLEEMTGQRVRQMGLELQAVSVKDVMFPGKLKETFAQVVAARKEALASLERARGETAALRNLANAARLVAREPGLLHLRIVQAIGESRGTTLVVGMPELSTLLKTSSSPDAEPGESASDLT